MVATPVMDDAFASLRLARVVFTGKLGSISRGEAADLVRAGGGQVKTSVSRRTSMLVVGMEGWPVLPDGSVSRCLRRAEELNASGAHVRIVPEAEFLELVGVRERRPETRKGYSFRQVCEVLSLPPTTVRRWEALGLIRAEGGRYDFQDIVSLRTIGELSGRGVTPATIGRTVRGLRSVLPDVERPLAQLKIVEQSGALLAELGETLLGPDGQLVLNFAPSRKEVSMKVDVLTPQRERTAEEWIDHGHRLEEEERFEEAAGAYRRALALEPARSEAHFNLGNALRGLDRLEAAEAHLVMATTLDPAMAAAWYNLADVQEETDRPEEAIASLRAALQAWPDYADAHYNLALCCHQVGRLDEAADHWRAYLRVDQDSPWANTARAYLLSLES